MIDYMQRKVKKYCNEKREKGLDFSLYDVQKMLKKDCCFWNLSAVLYGKWIGETSNFKTKELSEQEW